MKRHRAGGGVPSLFGLQGPRSRTRSRHIGGAQRQAAAHGTVAPRPVSWELAVAAAPRVGRALRVANKIAEITANPPPGPPAEWWTDLHYAFSVKLLPKCTVRAENA